MNNVMFSSKTDLWETPQYFFDKLNEEFKFEIDLCALKNNTKCKKFYDPNDNNSYASSSKN